MKNLEKMPLEEVQAFQPSLEWEMNCLSEEEIVKFTHCLEKIKEKVRHYVEVDSGHSSYVVDAHLCYDNAINCWTLIAFTCSHTERERESNVLNSVVLETAEGGWPVPPIR